MVGLGFAVPPSLWRVCGVCSVFGSNTRRDHLKFAYGAIIQSIIIIIIAADLAIFGNIPFICWEILALSRFSGRERVKTPKKITSLHNVLVSQTNGR